MAQSNVKDEELAKANARLARMSNAVASNALSGNQLNSEEGKALMQHMLTSVMSGDFDPSESRDMIKSRLHMAAKG